MHSASTIGRLLGDLEREVMTCVWKRGAETVRAVCDALPKKDAAYTTVMTIMNRLVEKGLLTRNEEKQPHVYRPRYSEAEFYRTVAGTLLDRIRKDFGTVAVACFVEEAEKLSKKKLRKALQKMKIHHNPPLSKGDRGGFPA